MEVMNMSLTEFNQEEYDRNRHEEGFADGERSKAQDAARNMLADGCHWER
ncbi:MAG: hypothetical protein IJL80_02790 [Treponema sp.]|nr:hypothetical protein [Treponema sp.]